ncbi:MAG: AMP-binding protein [Atopobiaceae bacterium]|nr:AMP-binding protein [Atopobiaceae bacterium]
MRTLIDAVLLHAEETPNKLAVAFKGEAYAYAELRDAACAAARGLAGAGVARGARVCLQCLPRPATLACYLGIHMLGATAVMVDKAAGAQDAQTAMRISDASVLVSEGDAPEGAAVLLPRDLCAGEAGDGVFEPCAWEDEEPWDIIFTTGTTGEPKGATLSARAVCAITRNNVAGAGMRADDVILVPLPLHHSVALRVCRAALELGASIVLQNGFVFAREVERNIERFGCTAMVAVPASMETVRQQMQGKFGQVVGGLRYVEVGAGALSLAQRKTLFEELPNTRVISTYGSSETGGTLFLDVCEAVRTGRGLEAAGKPVVGVEVGLADVRADGCGRLRLRGKMLMSGYWGRNDLTAEVAGGDGWLLSGDMARMDDDGFVYLLGRADDIINMGGENISPVEVENAASLCDGVAECACIGVDDPEGTLGQIPVLYAVPGGTALDERVLRAQLVERLGSKKAPREVVVVESLPRNAMQKVRKDRLHELWEECGTSLSMGPVAQAVLRRSSVREFERRPVLKAVVDAVVRAAIQAPNGHNMQTWRFTVLEDAETIGRLRDATFVAAKEQKVSVYGFGEPAFAVVVSNDRRNADGCQDCSAAAMAMLLVAQEHGLGGTWMNGLMTLRDVEPVKGVLDGLGVPARHVVWATLLFGYAAKRPTKPARKPDAIRYANR